jgi:hypothetical protein
MVWTPVVISLPFYFRASTCDTASLLVAGYEKINCIALTWMTLSQVLMKLVVIINLMEEPTSDGIGENGMEYPFLCVVSRSQTTHVILYDVV